MQLAHNQVRHQTSPGKFPWKFLMMIRLPFSEGCSWTFCEVVSVGVRKYQSLFCFRFLLVYSVSFMFCMLMLALQRKGFWQSSLLGKLQTPPMTSLQPWDRTARIKWAQKRSYQRPTRYMKGYILPGGYRGRFALSIVRHCEEQVGIAGAVFNIPIFKKSWVGFILHPKYKVFWPINSYLSWDSCAMFVNVIIISDTHLVRVYIKTVVDKRKEKCRPRFSCTRCFLVCTIYY